MNWDYIAGFFDGEGTVAVKKHTKGGFQLEIQIWNTRLEVLDKIKSFLVGKIGIHGPIWTRGEKENAKEIYCLGIYSKIDCENFLKKIKKKVIVKKQAIDYVLKNYSFDRGGNRDFNLSEFRKFVKRGIT